MNVHDASNGDKQIDAMRPHLFPWYLEDRLALLIQHAPFPVQPPHGLVLLAFKGSLALALQADLQQQSSR